MILIRPVFHVFPLILFPSLCCGTGYLLTITPYSQARFAPTEASMTCYFNTPCTDPTWSGPALNDISRSSTTRTDHSSTLTIRDLKEEDQGQYICSCNGNSVMSSLIVNHYPNVDNVRRNQTFFRGRTVAIVCNSYPGQPEEDLFWVRDDNIITTDLSSRVRRDGDHVVIENIRDDDSGIYVCGYIVAIGFINAEITVNVVEPPLNIPNPLLPAEIIFVYNESQPLEIWCNEHLLDDPHPYSYSWVVRSVFTIQGPKLSIPHDEVLPGFHNCFIQKESTGLVFEYPVFVNVIQTPPVISDHRPIWHLAANEYGVLFLEIPLRFELDGEISYQWQNLLGENRNVNFQSRVCYNVFGKTVNVTVDEVRLSDRGRYLLIISNQYGSDDITVEVSVAKLIRTIVEAKFTNLQCDQIEIVGEIIADAFECEICGVVRIDSSCIEVTPDCDEDSETEDEHVSRLLQLALIAQDHLPPVSVSSLEETLVSAQVPAILEDIYLV